MEDVTFIGWEPPLYETLCVCLSVPEIVCFSMPRALHSKFQMGEDQSKNIDNPKYEVDIKNDNSPENEDNLNPTRPGGGPSPLAFLFIAFKRI